MKDINLFDQLEPIIGTLAKGFVRSVVKGNLLLEPFGRLVITLVYLAWSIFPAAAAELTVRVEPKLELLFAIQRSAGIQDTYMVPETPYTAAVDRWIQKWKHHPAVRKTLEMHQNGIRYGAIPMQTYGRLRPATSLSSRKSSGIA